MKKLKRNDVVVVIGKRWFERVNGNTYHSCYVSVNGEPAGENKFEYGYGNQWEYTGLSLLKLHYKVPEDVTSLWKLKNYGIKLFTHYTDVSAKKYL